MCAFGHTYVCLCVMLQINIYVVLNIQNSWVPRYRPEHLNYVFEYSNFDVFVKQEIYLGKGCLKGIRDL